MIKAIFYDFDGVIKESTQIKTEAFYALYLPYGKEVAEKAKAHHIAHGGISRFEKFKLYHKDFLSIDLDNQGVKDLANQFSEIVLNKVIACDYVAGAKDSLQDLQGKYQQFIVTGTPQNEIEVICDQLNIQDLFVAIKGSPANKIEISKILLEQYNLKPDEVVFIGDATTDYKAAKHYQFDFILREHDENKELFKSEDVIKLADLTDLETAIQGLK